jgi:hypothetical protein
VFEGSRQPPAESGKTGLRPLDAILRRRNIDTAKAGSVSVRSPAAVLVALAEQTNALQWTIVCSTRTVPAPRSRSSQVMASLDDPHTLDPGCLTRQEPR